MHNSAFDAAFSPCNGVGRLIGGKMADWIAVGPQELLGDGAMQEVQAGDQTILLARVEGSYYAVQSRCPHLRGHLARGRLDGRVVTCPLHGSTFDVTTGANLEWVEGLPGVVRSVARALSTPHGLETFAVKVEEGRVWVEL
jgi:nitrite reductase/ring-hydroxylating ferredoxin subunit